MGSSTRPLSSPPVASPSASASSSATIIRLYWPHCQVSFLLKNIYLYYVYLRSGNGQKFKGFIFWTLDLWVNNILESFLNHCKENIFPDSAKCSILCLYFWLGLYDMSKNRLNSNWLMFWANLLARVYAVCFINRI